MKYASDFRQSARNALRGKWGLAVLAGIIASLLGAGGTSLPNYSFETMLLDNIVFVTALFYKEDWEKVGGFSTTMAAGMEDYDLECKMDYPQGAYGNSCS